MTMLHINEKIANQLRGKYDNCTIEVHSPSRSWQTSRYIQLFVNGYDHDLHYEYRIDDQWNGRVELHFEGDWEKKYGVLIDRLINNTQNHDELIWSEWLYGYRCQHSGKINDIDQLFKTLSDMMELFGKQIRSLSCEIPSFEQQIINCDGGLPQQDGKVDIFEKKLGEILRLPLAIPNYQRK